MCVPGCREAVYSRLSRRDFLRAATAATLATAIAQVTAGTLLADEDDGVVARVVGRRFNTVVDLTHVTTPNFPTYFGQPQLELEPLYTFDVNGFNMYRWHLVEHTGTHMDAPFHFSAGEWSADQIPISRLVVPLVVVDIRAKAGQNPDAQVAPDDLRAWERRYGRIPEGACVAMQSGWADKVDTPEFRNADANGVLHFPGFHVEAVDFLIEERSVYGIAVDTLSLDYGPSPDFVTHYRWLPTNRWGLEAIANLDKVPPRGSTLIVGGPKIAGATGGMSRLIALVRADDDTDDDD
jgi:kynurenine formamidase